MSRMSRCASDRTEWREARSLKVTALAALLLSCTSPPPAIHSSSPAPPAAASIQSASDADAGPTDAGAADTGAASAADAGSTPDPFTLPPVVFAAGGRPALRDASLYLTAQFYRDCGQPRPVSGWAGPGRTWHVTAYRCVDPVADRPTPSPWLSDGWLFLWASRGTLVIEVEAHQRAGPTAAQWRAYLETAIALEPRPAAIDAGAEAIEAAVRFDHQKMASFLAKLRRMAGSPGRETTGRCVDEYHALGREVDAILPSPPGVFENAMRYTADCHYGCDRESCAAALRSIQRASDWARQQPK